MAGAKRHINYCSNEDIERWQIIFGGMPRAEIALGDGTTLRNHLAYNWFLSVDKDSILISCG